MFKRIVVSLCAASVIGSAIAAPVSARPARSNVTLVGAGSTFDFPYFDKAFAVYRTKTQVSINYQPIGSGAGIQQFTAKLVDFGASDVPMDPTSELPAAVKAGGPVAQIPIALGGVSIAYNLPRVKSGLRLNGPTLARIYLGTIKKWNDREIKKLNPRVRLPDLAITVVHRSDASGTSYAFTNYLSTVNARWHDWLGVSKSPAWPAGIGGKGNLGVAQLVQQTTGAIGYIELAYVLQTRMKQAKLENRAGSFLFPGSKTVAADASSFKKVSAQRFSIVNGRAKNAYPIATYSWLLVYRQQSDPAKGKALVALVKWLLTSGQQYAKKLDYVPLPKSVMKIGLQELKRVRT